VSAPRQHPLPNAREIDAQGAAVGAILVSAASVLVPAAAVGAVIDVASGDVVQVRIVRRSRKRTNRYGALADRPLDLDPEDLATVRERMWASFGADDEP